MTKLTKLPTTWDFPAEGSPLPDGSITMIEFLSKKVLNDYEPSQFHPFRQRLLDWLNNVDNEPDQQQLLALLLDVFFVGRREFEALYRTVFHGNLFRWMIDSENIDIFGKDLEKNVLDKVNRAWICPISDSLRINSFLKVNGLKSLDKRPDWRSLKQFGDVARIQDYVQKKQIRHLVLLEDFVGSGTQAKGVVQFAAEALPNTQILLCPLIVCPLGDSELTKTVNGLDNVTYDPALLLPDSVFHSYENTKTEQITETEAFLCRLKEKLGMSSDKQMFGFKQTGAKVVMYSNCPNNSLPIFHFESDTWNPLFPRVNRQ